MFPLRRPGRHRFVCLILLWSNSAAVLATSPENPNSFRLEIPIESQYTTDDLFAALSPNCVAGSATLDKFTREEQRVGNKRPTQGFPIPESQFIPTSSQARVLAPDLNGALRGTPRRRIDKQVDTEKNSKRAEARTQELVKVAELLQKHPLSFNARLATIDETFGNLDYWAVTRLDRLTHPSLPYGWYMRDTRIGMLKVLKRNLHPQSNEVLSVHYRNLILFMHKLYEEALENLGIPITAQVEHQVKMLKWLDGEIFDTTRGYPILGIITAPFPLWKEDLAEKSIRPSQINLLKFFSQAGNALGLLPDTASKLITEFRRESE
ncbi:hypothetical protein PtA15_14A351 [Puccinia triticina]|uniref:Uncharacterized protein n=1 Tax=Puccinia triticina TaxID=208348 RepID=A0ABY7D985_9BASI|nr:uncharacterized protein PtA15_14A351 [Puccinia triticina]WAQ91467.1 hypothetical protein PtA15_14A351 [Puccinia triticina]